MRSNAGRHSDQAVLTLEAGRCFVRNGMDAPAATAASMCRSGSVIDHSRGDALDVGLLDRGRQRLLGGARRSVQASGNVRRASCSKCAQRSSQVHGRYRRTLSDQPTFGRPVTITLEVRRSKCGNPNCSQRTFSERLDALAAPGQRRTRRLNDALCWLGFTRHRSQIIRKRPAIRKRGPEALLTIRA